MMAGRGLGAARFLMAAWPDVAGVAPIEQPWARVL